MCFIMSVSLYSCEYSSQTKPMLKKSKKLIIKQSRRTLPTPSPPKLIAASTATSPLVKGLLQQARSGRNLEFELRYNIDHAVAALRDHKVIAAFQLNYPQKDKSSGAIKVAKTNLWWASKQTLPRLSHQQWQALVSKEQSLLPNGKGFQLCLRAKPDRLEELWVKLNPEDKSILEYARQSGQWPIFNDETTLLEHLNQRPEAIALFTEGNLKLKGAPFSQVTFTTDKSTQVLVELHLLPQLKEKKRPKVLQTLLNTLNSAERENAVREWGWNP